MRSKKLENIWECSRFMLPEHERRIQYDNRDREMRTKPELDEQEIGSIEQILAKSIEDHSAVTLTLFRPDRDQEYRGIVMSVDRHLMRIKLRWSDEHWDWIPIGDIIKAYV
ncbi:YolD-like family protein [Paenibacillus wynnii]|uniref:YolD-like protein n=1 Tax=Paenibacillus wynnii TaxID=268407 RepID=A0A098M4G7_9BACL|nr:YolD-like family protein [Paenibacillus wynnii]KGE16918.1 hypothetical protein PWYN_19790 [Paenibacillus wynnii]